MSRVKQVMVVRVIHLRVASTRGAALDAESGALAGLADAGEDLLAQSCTERLRQAYGGGALALAQGRGVDAGDDDVVAVGLLREVRALQEAGLDLGLVRTIQVEIGPGQPKLLAEVPHRHRGHGLERREHGLRFEEWGRGGVRFHTHACTHVCI
jgi:hypothetical protein